jgi:hypothetical protein
METLAKAGRSRHREMDVARASEILREKFAEVDGFGPQQVGAAAHAQIDLAQIEHTALHRAAIGQARVFDNASVVVWLAVFVVSAAAQKHDGAKF